MSSLPSSLPTDQKMFFKLAEIFLIISSEKENFLVLAVFRRTFSIGKKNPTSTFKIGDFRCQKMFFKFAEILLIITPEKEKFLVLAVSLKTFSIGKKSNFNFQNRGKK